MYPCETFARYALPKFRLLVARELIEKYGLTQIEAGRKLGITQAAISQYFHQKRGRKVIPKFEEAKQSEIEESVGEIAKRIVEGNISSDEISDRFCKLCFLLREKGKLREPDTNKDLFYEI